MALTWTDRSGRPRYLSLAAGAFTLSVAGELNVSFDGAGRLIGLWADGVTYRRGLDNRVLAKQPSPGGQRTRTLLTDANQRPIIEQAYAVAQQLAHDLTHAALNLGATTDAELGAVTDWLARILTWDWPALVADAARFHTIYKPISILPPDQYLALVLQATEGCSYNRCTFCTFYRDRPFRIKSPAEFAGHCDAVAAFMDAGITVRRSIFLADANAVIIPRDRLLPLLDVVHSRFAVDGVPAATSAAPCLAAARAGQFTGIYAFVSAPDALHKAPADFADLAQRGLTRLYVGVETGYDPLRAFIAKPGRAADVLDAVRAIKTGGIAVGVILLVGVGGVPYREDHFAATVQLVTQLPLGPGDLVYLSPFVDESAAPYLSAMRTAGYRSLAPDDLRAEEIRFRHALQPWARAHGVRISRYDIREFIY